MINLRRYILATSCVFIFSCTSSTNLTLNDPIAPSTKISKTLKNPEQRILKRVIAIGRFSDETKRGNSFFLDNNGNRIGKQASDILAARLTSSNKFIMLERSDLNLVADEGSLDKVGSKYLIIGSVSEYGRSTTSDVGVFSRNKKQIANVTVNIRIVDTRTGQIIYSEEGSGEAVSEANKTFGVGETAGYDQSLDDKALSAAISKLTSNIMNNLLDEPWESYILSADGGNIILAGGKTQGIKVNDTFDVLVKGKQIKNPQTGLKVQLPGTKIAKVKAISLAGTGNNEVTIVNVVSGSINNKNLSQYIVQEEEK